jgi:uncharacterized membrane protein (DUF485 family)
MIVASARRPGANELNQPTGIAMAHFDHAPAEDEPVNEHDARRRARYGLWLFAIYLVLYAGFMLLNVFAPATMEMTPFAGVNLAVLYGFALIAAALILALVYAWLCRTADGEAR